MLKFALSTYTNLGKAKSSCLNFNVFFFSQLCFDPVAVCAVRSFSGQGTLTLY